MICFSDEPSGAKKARTASIDRCMIAPMSTPARVWATVVLLVGCGKVNVQPDGQAGGDDAPTVEDANPMCNGVNQCVAVPPGWTGPVTYAAQASEPPSCGGAYATQVLAARQGLDVGTQSCGCTCPAISNFTCGAVTGTGYSDTACATGLGSFNMNVNTCTLASNFTTSNSFNFDLGNPSGVSCGAPTPTEVIPTPTWATNVKVCGGVQDAMPGVCGQDAVCVPAGSPPYGPVCVYQAGDHQCPADFATTRELVYGDFEDTRDCTTCTCTAQNATCTATVTRYQNSMNNCSGSTATLTVTTAGSNCITKASQTSFQTTAITKNPNATCAQGGATATGSAGPINPTTICCR